MDSKKINSVYQYPCHKGFGSFLRSCLSLCEYCIRRKYQFNVVFNHPIENILIHAVHEDNSPLMIPTWTELDALIESIPEQSSFNVLLGAEDLSLEVLTDNSLNGIAVKKHIKNMVIQKALNFKSSIHSLFLKKLHAIQLKIRNYTILHVRFGDITLIHRMQPCIITLKNLHKRLDALMLDPSQTLLICDTYAITKDLQLKYNLKTFDSRAIHTGKIHPEKIPLDEPAFLDTFIEFMALCYSKKIIAINGVHYTSNFSHAAARLFDVPYQVFHLKHNYECQDKPICANCKDILDVIETQPANTLQNLHEFILCEGLPISHG